MRGDANDALTDALSTQVKSISSNNNKNKNNNLNNSTNIKSNVKHCTHSTIIIIIITQVFCNVLVLCELVLCNN